MNHRFFKTAVALITLLFVASACSNATQEAETPEIAGPAFILFYTDN